jgi:ATP-dependent DNA ligase
MASTAIHVRDYRTEIPGGLSDPQTWRFPVVQSVNSHGKATTWQIYVRLVRSTAPLPPADAPLNAFVDILDGYYDNSTMNCQGTVGVDNFSAWINVDSGLVGGKIRKSVPTVVASGKRAGTKAETNPWTQALRDAYGLHNKQVKKSNGVQHDVGVVMYPPMLAQVLATQTVSPVDGVTPVWVQPKYNGVRAVSTYDGTGIIMYSRRRNIYPGFGYIKAELLPAIQEFWADGNQLYLDGEIYKDGVRLQDISGAARRAADDDERYEYMIYDCFVANKPDMLYSERKELLEAIFDDNVFKYAKPVTTYEVTTAAEVDEAYHKYIEAGLEGAMLRTDDVYQYSYNDHHSKVLLKIKPTLDGEYEVVGFTTGERGKAADALMMICRVGDGVFNVTPAMELPERIALAKLMTTVEPNGHTHFENQWKGRMIVVYFDEKSADDVPQRARTSMEVRTWD